MEIPALSFSDSRVYRAKVAGPAALLVAKLHRLGERQDTPTRLVDKDAHDIYRILVAIQTEDLAARLRQLQTDGLAGQVTNMAIDYLNQLFAAGPHAIGSMMAGRAETGVGDPLVVSASVAALAEDLVRALGHRLVGTRVTPRMKRSSSACDMAAAAGGVTARTGSIRGPVLARRFRETVIIDDNR